MRKLPVIIFLLFSSICFAQLPQDISAENNTAPNQDSIKLAVLSDTSPYFYPNLVVRYLDGDTTLNKEEYKHLYYGYIYEDTYRPLEIVNYKDSINNALSLNKSDSTISPEIFDMLERYTAKVLSVEPFNLAYLNFMTFIEQSRGNIEEAERYAYKLKMIKETIFSSGTGLSKESPWHVLYRSDEQDILSSLGVTYSKPILASATIEYFHLPIKNNGNRGYYFDTNRLYIKRPDGDPASPKRRFEFNPFDNPRSSRHIKYQQY